MGPSISLCEGQGNTCINKNTRMCTHTHAHGHKCCHAVVVAVVGGGVWPSWDLAVFQHWSEHVRKCAYTKATHAGSTILQSMAVLQCLQRLQIKHTITYMKPCGDSACEEWNGALKPFRLCGHADFQSFISVWDFSITVNVRRAIKSEL